MEAAKREIQEEEESEPKLKCHEMRLIFQHLSTSQLICFISNLPKHPLGKFWSQELKFVVEKRLPFSFRSTCALTLDHSIFDCNGSHVAKIERPKQFYLSPICELIQCAKVRAAGPNAWTSLPLRLVFPTSGILSTLTNLDTLFLSIDNVTLDGLRDSVYLPPVLNPEFMSRVKSLTISHFDFRDKLVKPLSEIISRATSLRKLGVPYIDLDLQILLAALPSDLPGHYSSLESLSVKHLEDAAAQPLLELLTTRFNGLRELLLPVRAPIRQYLAAFQALPSLATLRLDFDRLAGDEYAEKHFAVDENDASVVSVTELLIAYSSSGKATRALLAMLSKFPNVRTFGADFLSHESRLGCDRHVDPEPLLHFASAVCAGGVFRHLQALKLFAEGCWVSLPSETLLQFIRANIDHLPKSVDFSQLPTEIPLWLDCDFLVDLCLALQSGRTTSLLLKVDVHRDAVPRLREHFALTKQAESTPQANVGQILAWIDEGSIIERRIYANVVRRPKSVCEFTDFRIEALKTSGPLKGSSFTVRISDFLQAET